MNREAWKFELFGIVQGVGFRPFIHRLAQHFKLNGWVHNSSSGLTIWAEGEVESLKLFKKDLLTNPPSLAKIDKHEITIFKTIAGYKTFAINSSASDPTGYTFIPPDTGICDQCFQEFNEATNRRHNYLLINCAECGPRFSIIHKLPYDRQSTSMINFLLCPNCQSEYNDINSRRYHTEAIACPACGPQVWLADQTGNKIDESASELIKLGKIIAIKGIGGFHLACDALNEPAIANLRARKRRNDKPFALMFRDLDVVKEYCQINTDEMALLSSREKPIVLLYKTNTKYLPNNISEGLNTLGTMLPYTAIHHSLFDDELKVIVLTSANLSGEPLIDNNEEALEKLHDIADFFLFHDRPIVNSCDDSVVAIYNSEPVIHRRSRGYVPLPICMAKTFRSVFACGGDLKSTFCILKGNHGFLSQYFGDLSYYENYRRYIYAVSFFKQMTRTNPEIIAHDLHPGYISTRYAKSLKDVVTIGVQHHHAHLASCMAENNVTAPVLGVICDGTGYGTDGAIWGFEFLYGDYGIFERLAHLDYLPLPGGDAAVFDPSHIAFSYLYNILGNSELAVAKKLLPHLTNSDVSTLQMQLGRKIGIWPTSSCGRLFDAVSALLGICTRVSYEGQAAMLLESISYKNGNVTPYRFELTGQRYPYHLNVNNMFEDILSDLHKGIAKEIIGSRFHATVIDMVVSTVLHLSWEKQCNQVALSGGTFQNRILIENIMNGLKNNGLQVFIQRKVPTNDGGLSLGQAVVGEEAYKRVSGGNWQGTQG